MSSTPSRPLSPHLSVYKWSWAMAVSILHRITGGALTVAGLAVLVWWLAAMAGGAQSYQTFQDAAGSVPGLIVLFGLTWAFFQHLLSGLRHLVLDMGAGYDLKVNRFWAAMTIVGSVALTVLTFAWLIGPLPAMIQGVN